MTPLAILVLALTAFARQDPPGSTERRTPVTPARPEGENRERAPRGPQELEREVAELQKHIRSLPTDSALREQLIQNLRKLEEELAARRRAGAQDPNSRGRAVRPPEPPEPPAPPGGERRRDPALREQEGVRAWLRENEPETFRRLSGLENEGRRGEAQEMLAQVQARMRGWGEMKERDPEGFQRLQALRQMERESLELAEQTRRAPAEERPALSEKLKELLGRLFEAREEARSRELAEMKRRVEEIEKSQGTRRASKDRIVERRRRELLGEKSEDDW